MAVNKNIWETQTTFTINNAKYEQSKSIGDLFTAGKLILNADFDKSIYMWDRDPLIYNFYRLIYKLPWSGSYIFYTKCLFVF